MYSWLRNVDMQSYYISKDNSLTLLMKSLFAQYNRQNRILHGHNTECLGPTQKVLLVFTNFKHVKSFIDLRLFICQKVDAWLSILLTWHLSSCAKGFNFN